MVKDGEALHFGTLFHMGLEAWWMTPDARLDAALAAVAGLGWDELEQVRVEELLRAYHDRWESTADDYEVLELESTFVAPLLNPESERSSRTWMLSGKFDGVVKEKSTGRVIVVEHKTTSEDITDSSCSYWLRLLMDGQVTQYHVGALSKGYDTWGTLYDVAKKAQIRPSRTGKPRKRKTESDAEFEERKEIEAPYETPEQFRLRLREYYATHLTEHFKRKPVARTHEQLVEFMQDAWQEARMAHESELKGIAPRNPDACEKWGRTCEFFEHCAFGADLVRDQRFKRLAFPHPELDREEVQSCL